MCDISNGAKHSPLTKIFAGPKVGFEGGCHAKMFQRHKIEIFEYQMIISENGAYCAARGDIEVECNVALITIRARLMSSQFGFVGFMKVQT